MLLAAAAMGQQKLQEREAFIELDESGSAPPLPQLYECASQLGLRPYDAAQAESCLQEILGSGYFAGGRIENEPTERNLIVHFRLVVAPLQLQSVDFEGAGSFRDAMLDRLAKTGDFLRGGDIYQSDVDVRIADDLGVFFRDAGKAAGITRIVNLNYGTKTASLIYRITLGPDRVPERALPPSAEPDVCVYMHV